MHNVTHILLCCMAQTTKAQTSLHIGSAHPWSLVSAFVIRSLASMIA